MDYISFYEFLTNTKIQIHEENGYQFKKVLNNYINRITIEVTNLRNPSEPIRELKITKQGMEVILLCPFNDTLLEMVNGYMGWVAVYFAKGGETPYEMLLRCAKDSNFLQQRYGCMTISHYTFSGRVVRYADRYGNKYNVHYKGLSRYNAFIEAIAVIEKTDIEIIKKAYGGRLRFLLESICGVIRA